MSHKPLRAACVFAGQSHSHCAATIFDLIDLAANLVAGSAISITAWIATLNYKVWNDAMKRNAVEVSATRQLYKTIDCQWCIIRQ